MGICYCTLKDIPIRQKCIISAVTGNSDEIIRFYDLGFFQGSYVTPLYTCHGGGCRVYEIKKTLIALRENQASHILCMFKPEVICCGQ